MRYLIALLLLLPLLPSAARAQLCPAGTAAGAVGCQPAAVSPIGTDVLLGWQIEQVAPHTRIISLAQIAGYVGAQYAAGSISGGVNLGAFPLTLGVTSTPSAPASGGTIYVNGSNITRVLPAAGGSFDAPVLAAGSTTPRLASAIASDVRNVIAYGADPTGVADSAPAFRAAITSNTRVLVPPGTYLFASTQTAPCCAFDPPAVLVQSLSNFEIDGYGATITTATGIALSSAFQFDKDSHFSVRGLTVQGNRTGLTSGQENAGITLSSDVDFQVADIRLTGYGGNGAAIAGDWLVNGRFDRLQMDGVGHCYDVAYLKHVSFGIAHALGADTNGASGTGQVGQTCFSVIVDTPNAGQNNTGVAFTATDDVTVSGLEESNFSTGGLIETGTHYTLAGNSWHDNPGLGGSLGLGLWIHYNATTSVGVPPSGILISDKVFNNGAAVAGTGILISASAIANSDAISDVTILGSQIDNNATTGVNTDTASKTLVPDLKIFGDTFSGASQTIGLGLNAIAAASMSQTQQGSLAIPDTLTMPNNKAIQSRDSSNAAQLMIFGDGTNETVIRPLSSSADVLIQTFNGGANLMRFWSNHLEMDQPPTLPQTTVASLPACVAGLKGALYGVTDATAPTYNAALTGGGAVAILAYCNGTAWTAH